MKIRRGKLIYAPRFKPYLDIWFSEMQENGWLRSHAVSFKDERDRYVVAIDEAGKVASFLFYSVYYDNCGETGQYNVNAAWTAPEHRRKGFYGSLWKELVKIAKREKCRVVINSGYHRKNQVSAAMQRSQNRQVFDYGGNFISTSYRPQEN